MKRILLPMIVVLLSGLCFVMGTAFLNNVSNANKLETIDGVRYLYLHNPIGITHVSTENIVIVDQLAGGTLYEYTVRKTTGEVIEEKSLGTTLPTILMIEEHTGMVRLSNNPFEVRRIETGSGGFEPFMYRIQSATSTLHVADISSDLDASFVVCFSLDEIYTINFKRKSIEWYGVILGGTPFHRGTIVAHRGDDKKNPDGYHLYLTDIAVIDSKRYLVSDISGVKLVNMSNPIGNQMKYFDDPAGRSLSAINKISYDGFQNIYLTQIDGVIYHYTIDTDDNIKFVAGDLETIPSWIDDINTRDGLGRKISDHVAYATEFAKTGGHNWSIDRETGKIYWINTTQHAVFSTELQNYFDIRTTGHYTWKSHIYTFEESRNTLFMNTINNAIVYKHPNRITPVSEIPKGTRVQVITYKSKVYNGSSPLTHLGEFDYAYAILGAGEAVYIDIRDLNNPTSPISFATPKHEIAEFDERNTNRIVRVLVNTYIYRFPMTKNYYRMTDEELIIAELPRNFGLTDEMETPGLEIIREINEIETGKRFYEIRYSIEDKLPPEGVPVGEVLPKFSHVGYIDAGLVMCSFTSPSRKGFSSNASVAVLPKDNPKYANGLPLHTFSDATNPMFTPTGDYLRPKQRVQVFDEKRDENGVLYYHVLYGIVEGNRLEGWVEAKYIIKDGMTVWHIVAIISIIVATCVIGFIIVRHIRLRKNGN